MCVSLLLVTWLVLQQLLDSTCTARQLQQHASASYSDIWTAYSNETSLFKYLASDAANNKMTDLFQDSKWDQVVTPMRSAATNPKLVGTGFYGSAEVTMRQAAEQCLTMPEWYDVLLSNPRMYVDYLKASSVPGVALHSSKFKDGMVLKTLNPAVNLTLGKKIINGTTHWVLRNASANKIPGTHQYQDINIIPGKMDIKAGAAWIHMIDRFTIRIDKYEPVFAGKRAEVLLRAGRSANSTTCPEPLLSTSSSSSSRALTIAQAVGVAVGSACVVLSGALLLYRQKGHKGCLHTKGGLWGLLAPVVAITNPDGTKHSYCGPEGPGGHPRGSKTGAAVVTACNALPSDSKIERFSSYSSSGSAWYGSSPFAAFLAHAVQPSSTETTNTQQQSASAAQLPIAATGTSSYYGCKSITASVPGSNQTSLVPSEGTSGDKLGFLPAGGIALEQGPEDPDWCSSSQGPMQLLATDSAPFGQIPRGLVVPLSELSLDELIGEGAEGKVYRGTWNHTDIAAKQYIPHLPANNQEGQAGSPDEAATAVAAAQAAFARQVYLLTRLNHPNLVRFCGVCLEQSLVVMEWCQNGSVFDIIRKAELELAGQGVGAQNTHQYCSYLSWDWRLAMLHDVAAGMCYLHGRQHIHGDLRSPNLFVGADGRVKIGDFGFTKRLARDKASLKVARITHPRWVAPELLINNILSPASDVFSFGIVMYELLTFKVPFERLRKEQVVLEVMRGGRPEVPPEDCLPPGTSSSTCLWSYIRLMEACWAQDPTARPSFDAIARRIKAMQRWRKVIGKMQAVEAVAVAVAARRVHSIAAARASTRTMQSTVDGQSNPPARRTASAPPTPRQKQQQQQQQQQQDRLWPLGLSPQLPSSFPLLWQHQGPLLHELHPSAWTSHISTADETTLLCSAVLNGERVAVIPTCPAAGVVEALASVADPAQIAEARVLVVASDLPSHQQCSSVQAFSASSGQMQEGIGSTQPGSTGADRR